MQLPAITLPQIDLPFAIPAMLHPSVVHFAIAIPVVILLLEVYNLFVKRKSIGVFSFILLLLTVLLFALAYLTGGVDGKETFDLLSEEGQTLLKEHKLSGTYLLLGSVVILLLKLFAISGNKFFKFIYIMALAGLIFCTFNQGKEGGELTYKHGANVAKVKALDDALFDANEALEELNATQTPQTVEAPAAIPTPATTEPEVAAETQVVPEPTEQVQELPTPDKTPETNENVHSILESVKKEMKETNDKALSTVTNAMEDMIEVVPSDVERVKIETH